MVFVELLLLYSTLTGLPWSIYSTFFLEDRHGFNKQTPVFFIKDQTKSLVLQLLIVPPIVLGLLYTIQLGGQAFFIYSWLFLAAITFLFVTVYQEFIAPLFDKFSPLPEGALHTSILSLTSSLSFPLKKIQVVEGSKRSAHSNAYLYGFWWNKVIVIFDTLLEPGLLGRKEGEGEEEKEEPPDKEGQKVKGCSEEEVMAVLAHELGHWSLSHTLKLLAVSQLNLLLSLSMFAFFIEQQDVYSSFGFHDSRPTIIGIILVFQLIFMPYNEAVQFALVQVVRRFEYQADGYARQLGRGAALRSALTKLSKDNLSFPVADSLYSAFHHTHPTFLERIKRLPKLD
ncbi:CAAX prenyl protease 1 homolog [Geodia barretti]|nr:CAAX prenyl protease 1 homolog [Geodia barretti]